MMRTDTYDAELWQLVPKKMADAQQIACAQAVRVDTTIINKLFIATRVYQEALAAAPTPPASAQSERAATLEEAAVLLCEVSQKYNNLEIIDALQEVAGVIRTRLARGSLAIAVEYAKRQSSTSAQSVEPIGYINSNWPQEKRQGWTTKLYADFSPMVARLPVYTAPPSAADVRDAALEELIEKMSGSILESTENLSDWGKGYNQSTKDTIAGLRALKSKKEA